MPADETTTIEALIRRRDSDLTAFLAPDRPRLSYGGLKDLLVETREQLTVLGVGRNDRVAIVLPNGPEMAACFVAVAASATTAPLNPAYKAEEFDFYLSDLGAKALIVLEGEDTPALEVARRHGVRILRLRVPTGAPAGGFELAADEPADSVPARTGEAAQPDDVALILHTSGTTSRPKMVPLLQRNLAASAKHVRSTLELGPADRCLNVMPLFHIHGLVAAVLGSLAGGGSIYLTPGFNALRFFVWLEDAMPTWYTAVPTMHQAIIGRAKGNAETIARNPLRFLRSSSSSMPPQVIKELEEIFGAPLIEAYGMTEATHQMASNPLPRDRILRHDRGFASDDQQPITAGAEKAGQRRPAGRPGRAHRERSRRAACARAHGGGRDLWPQRHAGLCGQSRGRRQIVLRGRRTALVQDRRPGRVRRGRLPADHRPAEGDHQPRRREGVPGRGRRGAHGPSGGAAGRDLRHAPREAGRGSRGRRGPARGSGDG